MRAFDWASTPLGSPEGWPQNLTDAIASHVSAAVVNAPAREDRRPREEATPAEEALRESERRHRELFESMIEAYCDVEMIDDGVGLDREALTTIFDLFRQAGDRKGSQGGLGIGLTLARQLVEMHGGAIEAHSEGAGHGAEFAIR